MIFCTFSKQIFIVSNFTNVFKKGDKLKEIMDFPFSIYSVCVYRPIRNFQFGMFHSSKSTAWLQPMLIILNM